MAHYFISYSRYEVTFVESLARELARRGVEPWVDFRNLLPGRAWQDQLEQAIDSTEAILLVVSRESMRSPAVCDEYTRALRDKRRIVLLIFQACPLPTDLARCEWVDFRASFKKAVDQLECLLKDKPQPITAPPPQRGFKMPPTPRLLTLLLVPVALNGALGIIIWFYLTNDILKRSDATVTIIDYLGLL